MAQIPANIAIFLARHNVNLIMLPPEAFLWLSKLLDAKAGDLFQLQAWEWRRDLNPVFPEFDLKRPMRQLKLAPLIGGNRCNGPTLGPGPIAEGGEA